MKYIGMPMGMWVLFAGSFQKQLTAVFGYDVDAAQLCHDRCVHSAGHTATADIKRNYKREENL